LIRIKKESNKGYILYQTGSETQRQTPGMKKNLQNDNFEVSSLIRCR